MHRCMKVIQDNKKAAQLADSGFLQITLTCSFRIHPKTFIFYLKTINVTRWRGTMLDRSKKNRVIRCQ